MLTFINTLLAALIPLQYYPYFDTYETFDTRATAETKSSGYVGYIAWEMGEALDEIYEKTHQAVLEHIDSHILNIRGELKALQLSGTQITKIITYRAFESKRFRAEQEAWSQWRGLESSYAYQQYADGTARLYMPHIVSNYGAYLRIQELRNQYQELFSPSIKTKHLWGTWEGEDLTLLIFEREKSNIVHIGEAQGTYDIHRGVLSIKTKEDESKETYWISIAGANEFLYLDCYDFAVQPPDEPFCQMIETILLNQLGHRYQERLSALDSWIEECLSNKDPETYWMERWADQAREEKELLQKCQAAWKAWSHLAYTSKTQLLPDGTSFSLSHSPEYNQAILKRIIDLNDELSLSSPSINTLILGNWECPEKDEKWEFKQEEQGFCYEVLQKGQCIEKGTYAFEEGNLKLFPKESSRITPLPIQLSEKEAQIFRKYLFGKFQLKKRYKKLSA